MKIRTIHYGLHYFDDETLKIAFYSFLLKSIILKENSHQNLINVECFWKNIYIFFVLLHSFYDHKIQKIVFYIFTIIKNITNISDETYC